MFKIIKDFSGASIGAYCIEGNKIIAKLREEQLTFSDAQLHDYNYHFCFGIKNENQKVAAAEVFINCNDSSDLPNHEALLFQGKSLHDEFAKFSGCSQTDTFKRYYIRLEILPLETIYIANYYFRQYETLVKLFDALGTKTNAKREVYGHSIESRELVGYSLKTGLGDDRPTVLITSGFHFPEQDTLATEAIMEFFSTQVNRNAYSQFDFSIVPIVNPDGFVHGYNGSNAAQINFYWKFEENNKIECPEAYYLWEFCKKIKPVLYFDFHSYTFQMERKKAGVYIKPTLFYEGRKVRALAKDINKTLIELCGGHYQKGRLTYAPSTIYTKLTAQFNTLTYAKFHLSLFEGIKKSKVLAVESIRIVLDLFRKHDLVSKSRILKMPFGRVSRSGVLAMLRRILFGPLYGAKRFLNRRRDTQKASCSQELLLTRDWPSFDGNPKRDVLQRRRNKELKKLSTYKNQVDMLDAVTKKVFNKRQGRILEVACGTGFFGLELANRGFNVVGLEIDPDLCDIVKRSASHFNVETSTITGDACDLPFGENKFDLVFSKSFFEHVYDIDKALKEQVRVLRKGGTLVIEDGNLLNVKSLFNLLVVYPWRTHGKYGGLKWLFGKHRVKSNLYEYLTYGRDEDIKTIYWWKKRITKEKDLIPLEIATTVRYSSSWLKRMFGFFAGGCLILAIKK